MNKKGAVATVVVWSIVLFLSIGFLLSAILSGGFGIMYAGFWGNGHDLVPVKEETVSAPVSVLDIQWAAGDVQLEVWDGDTIEITQSAQAGFSERRKFTYSAEQGTLSIQDGRKRFLLFGGGPTNLIVRLPEKEYAALHLNTVSGRVAGSGLSFGDVDLENVSGHIELSGNFCSLSTNTVSGSITVRSATMLQKLSSELVSGSLTLFLPENDGFTLELDKVSGSFQSDFSCRVSENHYTYGEGGPLFQADIVSGTVKILKNAVIQHP